MYAACINEIIQKTALVFFNREVKDIMHFSIERMFVLKHRGQHIHFMGDNLVIPNATPVHQLALMLCYAIFGHFPR